MVRAQAALGIGVERLLAAADALDAAGEHMTAARLTYSVVALRGVLAGRGCPSVLDLKRAFKSLTAAGASFFGCKTSATV